MKKKILVLYVFIALVLVCTNAYAAITMNVGLTADKTSVKPGEELVVTVDVKNISKEISSIEGYINIDENILKDINKDTIVSKDGKIEIKSGDKVTNKLSYAFNPTSTNADYDVVFNTKKENIENNDCFFVMDFNDAIKENSDLLKLKLQVKESATINEIKEAIKVDFIVAYSADEAEKSEPVSAALDIKVVKDETQKPAEDDKDNNKTDDDKKEDDNKNNNNGQDNNGGNNNNNNNNNNDNNNDKDKDKNQNKNTNTNQNTNRNTNTNTNGNRVANNTNTDGTIAGTKIPAAGAGMILIPITILAILAYISYNKYIKYKDI